MEDKKHLKKQRDFLLFSILLSEATLTLYIKNLYKTQKGVQCPISYG